MKQRFVTLVLVALVAALCVPPALGQATGTIKGACKDVEGKPITGAVVELVSSETGHKYQIKTNTKGEYFSLGINPGTYTVSLSKDGKELYKFNGVHVSLDEKVVDFDLKKEQAGSAAGQGLSAEQIKAMQEAQAKQQKEVNTVKALNEKLAASNQAIAAGDFDVAIAALTEATQMDSNRDLLWFKLGDAYRASALKQTESAEKQKRFEQAIDAYQKAVTVKQNSPDAAKDPEANLKLAAYYNNLAEVYSKANKTDDAIKNYNRAADLATTEA